MTDLKTFVGGKAVSIPRVEGQNSVFGPLILNGHRIIAPIVPSNFAGDTVTVRGGYDADAAWDATPVLSPGGEALTYTVPTSLDSAGAVLQNDDNPLAVAAANVIFLVSDGNESAIDNLNVMMRF